MDENIRQVLLENDRLDGDLESPSSFTYDDYLELKKEASHMEGFLKELELSQFSGLYVDRGLRERPIGGLSFELVGEIGLPRPTIWTPDKHPGL